MSQDMLTQIMAFTYSAAHYLGAGIISLVQRILPQAKAIATLTDPIGYLAILSIFVVLTITIKRVAVIILVAGWTLIAIRVVLMVLGI